MLANFDDIMAQKYAIMQQGANSEGQLRSAQAAGITGALPSENALRSAQAREATERAKTVGPTAAASIASTQAGIGQTNAQTNLIGQQGAQIQDELHASPAERLQYRYGMQNDGFGLSNMGGYANNGSSSLTPITGGLGMNGFGMDPSLNKIRPTTRVGAAGGATDIMGANDGTANGTMVGPQPAPVTGLMTLHDVMHHAMNALHAAGGATTVSPPPPAPGQTTTNGSWNPADLGGNSPNPNGQNQSLRRGLGMGVKAAGGATEISPMPGQGGSWGGPVANPNAPQPPAAPPVAFPLPPGTPAGGFGKRVQAAGGATNVDWNPGGGSNMAVEGGHAVPMTHDAVTGAEVPMYSKGTAQVNAKGGAAKVPGNGPPNVDSVPAVLAPQEAVLNAGAAHHLGRGTIAALNALGAAKMAAHGMAPETPPTAHGVPGRGMPPKSAAKAPAKGAPPPAKSQGKPPAKPQGKPSAPVAKKAGAK